MDLSRCNLTNFQSNALRQLQYGPSIKIGIQFNSSWWSIAPTSITGGQSYTDRIIYTTVYPSYGPDDTGNAVLIASYCWTDDASRLGALIGAFDPKNAQNDPLTILVLKDLAAVHGLDWKDLHGMCIDVFPYDWNQNINSMGAFAFFGPGKFADLYQSLTTPAANGRLHFAGEAVSTRHAWVVGALDSAWRAVFQLLMCLKADTDAEKKAKEEKIQQFFKQWGVNEDWLTAEKAAEQIDYSKLDRRIVWERGLLAKHLAATEYQWGADSYN